MLAMVNKNEVYSIINKGLVNAALIERCISQGQRLGNKIILPSIAAFMLKQEVAKIAREGNANKNVYYFEMDGICFKIVGCHLVKYC